MDSLTPDIFEQYVTVERDALAGLLGISEAAVVLMEINPSIKSIFWTLAPTDDDLVDRVDSFLADFGL